MKKVAIIVQRCHESVVGGSEALAWQYATLLKDVYEVDVLSTTATDAAYWTNVLPEGLEVREGINIRRFHVDVGYSPFRSELFARMVGDFRKFHLGEGRESNGHKKHFPWSIALQEDLVRRIGPYSGSLVKHLADHWAEYRAIIIVTYLYPTAYFSLLEIPKGRALFAPTLHDEEAAYLSVYQHAARRAHSMIWLTEAEQRLGTALWGELPGRVVAMPIDTAPREPARLGYPYALYCGRIDPNKGCTTLFDHFIRFKAENSSALRLVLTGKDDIPVPDHPDIDYRGFVSAEEKFHLMAGAQAYVMPSAKESLSIVALEAMAQGTPVLATAESPVLVDHIEQSGGGELFQDYESFAAALNRMISHDSSRARMGERGRAYVLDKYTAERVRASLMEAVESCPRSDEFVASTSFLMRKQTDEWKRQRAGADELTVEDLSKSPPLPLPAGWSEVNLRNLVRSVRVHDAPPEELKNYVDADFKRFVYTLGLVPEKSGQAILELGANPYFTTTLLRKFRDPKLSLANFFDGSHAEGEQTVTTDETGEVVDYAYQQFNCEKDRFPYADDSFDVVLFCEIIEHLLADPVHALGEIRRVLKPDGILVLTTPNVARLENVARIVAGENPYDPYSPHGPYGRHNREYTPRDLHELLSANGFNIRTMFTADVHPSSSPSVSLRALAPLVKDRPTDLGQYIFCQCSISPDAKTRDLVRPPWLYRTTQTENKLIRDPETPRQLPASYSLTFDQFREEFEKNLAACTWEPHPLYSVFTQYDADVYLNKKEAFLHKYRCMYAVARTVAPLRIIELGTSAGSSGDAYLSAAPDAEFLGLDVFGIGIRQSDGSFWDPYEVATLLFTDRGFKKWELMRADLRSLVRLPGSADLVIVDAAHDFQNEYADLHLALTARPCFIFVDDSDDETCGKPAIDKFLNEDIAAFVEFTLPISYEGGGLLIKLKNP